MQRTIITSNKETLWTVAPERREAVKSAHSIMPLIDAEFEETEYRGPLFNQLEKNNLVWEPGQVFEQYIGIDRAIWCTNAYLLDLHGFHTGIIPPGITLAFARQSWLRRYIGRRKILPPFHLNLFVQAKRPSYGRYVPKRLKDAGLKSPYWRFRITPHQQRRLEKLQATLGKDRAIVCYACPVFHKQRTLYKWTIKPKMIENSTFPGVDELHDHSSWNFCVPGATGIANAKIEIIDQPGLIERIGILVSEVQLKESPLIGDLGHLARSVIDAVGRRADFIGAQFAEGVRNIEDYATAFELEAGRAEVIAFLTVALFAELHGLNWFVIGNAL